ncbi:unnamed protein product [Boreogadus saida]
MNSAPLSIPSRALPASLSPRSPGLPERYVVPALGRTQAFERGPGRNLLKKERPRAGGRAGADRTLRGVLSFQGGRTRPPPLPASTSTPFQPTSTNTLSTPSSTPLYLHYHPSLPQPPILSFPTSLNLNLHLSLRTPPTHSTPILQPSLIPPPLSNPSSTPLYLVPTPPSTPDSVATPGGGYVHKR